jgi:hypothetical protein
MKHLYRVFFLHRSAYPKYGYVVLGKDGRPIVSPIQRVQPPASAVELERSILDRLPERPVLAALANTQRWAEWHRHFGLPSRLNPQIKDAPNRYVLTAFAYGCGLGPTQAARHFDGAVSADQLRFVDRCHIDIADLRNASADLVNLYAQFELPKFWGSGAAAIADGTHFATYEDNLLAERHIRYGKTGGIAYRHIADNYIALFSYFIACGHYEAVYILDALQLNASNLRPRRVHADTHGQSAALQNPRQRTPKPSNSLRQYDSIFGKQTSDLIAQPGSLADQALADSVDGQQILLLERLCRHESHCRSLGGLADRCRVVPIVLIGLHEGPHELCVDQPHLVSQFGECPRPMMRAATSLDRNHANWSIRQE